MESEAVHPKTEEPDADPSTSSIVEQIKSNPNYFDSFIDAIVETYNALNHDMGEHIRVTLGIVKGYAKAGQFEECEEYMKEVCEMWVARMKVASIPLSADMLETISQDRQFHKSENFMHEVQEYINTDYSPANGENVPNLSAPLYLYKSDLTSRSKSEIVRPLAEDLVELDLKCRNAFLLEIKKFLVSFSNTRDTCYKFDLKSATSFAAGPMLEWGMEEEKRAGKALLAAAAVAERRGWEDVQYDIYAMTNIIDELQSDPEDVEWEFTVWGFSDYEDTVQSEWDDEGEDEEDEDKDEDEEACEG